MQLNQKENNDPMATYKDQHPDSNKNRNDDSSMPVAISKNQSSVSQRPSRKAKTKEAVQRHLNRDVELLVDEKQEKKSSTRKDKLLGASTALTPVTNGINNGSKC